MNKNTRLTKIYLWFRNPVSLGGLLVFLISTCVGLPMMFFDLLFGNANPYAGIWTYLVLPIVATLGVGVALVGAWWYARKRSHDYWEKTEAVLPRVDLNNPQHRKLLVLTLLVGAVVSVLLTLTGYRAYHFSDSTEFCGKACHEVMKPEFVAYQHSPHARVDCVSCHIGPGADWFVRAKITGLYQVYSVAFNKFSRPIETPIKNLRPAQDTCEQCHWPEKFFGSQQKTFARTLSDEKNTPWEIQSLIRIGGGDPKTGAAPGIHWHMNIANAIYYKDTDGTRESIPWVRSVSKDGTTTDYFSEEATMSSDEIEKRPLRRMDCVDCHNRPSHVFQPPSDSIDHAFNTGVLDRSLPFFKREAVNAMSEVYATEQDALSKIEQHLMNFYQTSYPEVITAKKDILEANIKSVKEVFSRTIFPEMKADWRAHPNHIGHYQTDGCFRCHDGLHKSKEGKIISNDCNACHTFLAQGTPVPGKVVKLEAQSFIHPGESGLDVSGMKCSSCHASTPEP